MGNKDINWEKIGVYIAITASLLTVVFYIFQLKDDLSHTRERVATLEAKMDILMNAVRDHIK